jgi:cytochrome c oxidase cbb3-type subunit 4
VSQSVLGSISVVLVALAFTCVVWWAFSKHKKKDFDEAASLPFEHGELEQAKQNHEKSENKS